MESVPSRFTASNNTHNVNSKRVFFECRSGAPEDIIMKGLHGAVMTSKVKALANDSHIDGVAEVGLKGARIAAVGEHYLNMKGIWVRHDGDGL